MRSFNRSALILTVLMPMVAQAALNFDNTTTRIGPIAATVYGFTPSGGSSPYTFSYIPGTTTIPGFQLVNSPNLPTSLAAGQTGALIGIPMGASHTATTSYTTSIRLADSTGAFVDKPVTIQVNPLDFAGATANDLGAGDTANIQFYPVDGTPPYTFSISSGTPPAGLTLNAATGLLSGMLTTAGSSTFTVKLQDSASPTPLAATHTFTMAVSPLRIANLTNRILPNGTVNTSYSFQLSVSGGTAPYTFALALGASLPAGLTLSAGGLVSGIPTTSAYSFDTTITISDAASITTSIRVAINILPTTPGVLGLTTETLPDVDLGSNSLFGVAASGGVPPYSFDVAPGSNLPAGSFFLNGFSISADVGPDRGLLRSRIHTPGNYTFVLRVTDSTGAQATRPYTLHATPIGFWYGGLPINGAPPPVLGSPYSWYLVALGGTPPYSVTPVNVPAGLAVDNTGFVSGTPGESGLDLPLFFALADSGGSTYTSSGSITIDPTPAAPTPLFCSGGDLGTAQLGDVYIADITCLNSPQNPPVFSVSVLSGSFPPGLIVLAANGLNNGGNLNVAAQVAGVPNQTGNYSFTLHITDGMGNIGQRQIKLHVSGLAIVNTGIAAGTVATPYTQTLDVRGGTAPYAFSLTGSLPTGISIDPASGAISGTPSTAGSYLVTVQVTDSMGDKLTRNYTLNIYQVAIGSPNVLPNAVYGQPYSYTFTASPSGSYQWTTTSTLPSGLSLNTGTGVLSGTPIQTTGAFSIALTATNGSMSANKTFTLFLTSQSLQPVLVGLPEEPFGVVAVVGAQVRAVLNVSGGTPPYTISPVSPSSLPPGLSIVPNNQYTGAVGFGQFAIAGIPTTAGNYNFALRYADSAGVAENRTVSMNISNLALATLNPPIGFLGVPYSAQLYGVGGGGTYTFGLASFHDNVMPPGLTLSPTGSVTGTPTSTGLYNVTIQLTSGSLTRLAQVTFTIDATTTFQRVDFDFGPILDDVTAGKLRTVLITPSSGAGTLTWSVVGGLPPGMQLYQGSSLPANYPAIAPQAVLAGAPSTPGTYNIGIKVTDSTGNFGVRFATLVVSPLAYGPLNDTYTLGVVVPPAQVGVPYSFAITMLSGKAPFTVSQDAGTYLPGGMTLSSPGLLSGTPTDPGNFTAYGILTDATGVSRRFTLGLTVYAAGSPIGTAGSQYTYLTSALVSAPYTFSLNNLILPNYGTAPFTWTLSPGSTMPPGLSIVPGSGSGGPSLSGTPGAAGTYTFALLATDAKGRQSLQYNTILVVSPLSVAPTALPSGVIGTAYSQTLTASGGALPYTYNLEWDSALPPGLNLSSSGVLSGTPAAATGTFLLAINVTDSAKNTVRVTYPLTITSAISSPGPAIQTSNGVVSAASFLPGIVGGSWATILGTNLSTTTRQWASADFQGNALPTNLSGVQVKMNGQPASIYYISPTQLNVQAPSPLSGSVVVQVIVNGISSNTVTATAVPNAPELFSYQAGANNFPAAVFLNGVVWGDPAAVPGTQRARPGDAIELYATGLESSPSGTIISKPIQTATPVTVTIGPAQAQVTYAGLVAVGEFQINITVPNLAPGNYPITIQIAGQASRASVVAPIGQ